MQPLAFFSQRHWMLLDLPAADSPPGLHRAPAVLLSLTSCIACPQLRSSPFLYLRVLKILFSYLLQFFCF